MAAALFYYHGRKNQTQSPKAMESIIKNTRIHTQKNNVSICILLTCYCSIGYFSIMDVVDVVNSVSPFCSEDSLLMTVSGAGVLFGKTLVV